MNHVTNATANAEAYATLAGTLATTVEALSVQELPVVAKGIGQWAGEVAVAMHPCAEFVVYVGPRGVAVTWAGEEEQGGAGGFMQGLYYSVDLAVMQAGEAVRKYAPAMMLALNALHA